MFLTLAKAMLPLAVVVTAWAPVITSGVAAAALVSSAFSSATTITCHHGATVKSTSLAFQLFGFVDNFKRAPQSDGDGRQNE